MNALVRFAHTSIFINPEHLKHLGFNNNDKENIHQELLGLLKRPVEPNKIRRNISFIVTSNDYSRMPSCNLEGISGYFYGSYKLINPGDKRQRDGKALILLLTLEDNDTQQKLIKCFKNKSVFQAIHFKLDGQVYQPIFND